MASSIGLRDFKYEMEDASGVGIAGIGSSICSTSKRTRSLCTATETEKRALSSRLCTMEHAARSSSSRASESEGRL
eukprot:5009551-Amphidinium_carterae.1